MQGQELLRSPRLGAGRPSASGGGLAALLRLLLGSAASMPGTPRRAELAIQGSRERTPWPRSPPHRGTALGLKAASRQLGTQKSWRSRARPGRDL